MKTPINNELEFFGTNQNDAYISMCNKIIANYNSLGGDMRPFTGVADINPNYKSTAIEMLLNKLSIIIFDRGDPLSVPSFLKRIVNKGIIDLGKPDGDAFSSLHETYLGKGHFRNGSAYTLNERELKAVRLYVNGNISDFATTEFRFRNLVITAKLIKSGVTFPNSKDNGLHNKYDVSVLNTGSQEKTSFDFYGSTHDYNNAVTEIAGKDLLQAFECFVSDAISGNYTFDDFCEEFGYDTDSRSAERIYKECVKSKEKAQQVIDADLYDFSNDLQEHLN